MRIAFVLGSFPLVSETFVLSHARALLARGHDVDIYSQMKPSEAIADLPPNVASRVINLAEMPSSHLARTLSTGALSLKDIAHGRIGLLRALNPARYGRDAISQKLFHQASSIAVPKSYDVIHAHFGPNALRTLQLRELGLLRGKLVTTFHGFDVSSYIAAHGATVYRLLFRDGDAFITVSDRMRRELIDLGSPPELTQHLPLGIDLTVFPYRPACATAERPVRVLSVGRLVPKKGFAIAIRAFAAIADRHPHVEYTIVGDGPLRAELEQLVASLGLTQRVSLRGALAQTAVSQMLAESDIFLLASHTGPNGDREGLPQTLLEAQAIGMPVVSTMHSGIPEAVVDGKSGFLVPEGDVDALAERLEFLVGNPSCWEAMGAAGRAFVAGHYDVEKSVDRLEDLYRRIA